MWGLLRLNIKSGFKRIRDAYVIHQAQSAKLPEFAPDDIQRYRIIFSGRVQKVGFRMEMCELAKRLELIGYCRNLENGNVEAELQGPHNRIKFLISFKESLKRIRIRGKTIEELAVKPAEVGFVQL